MPSISDRLRRLGVSIGSENLRPAKEREKPDIQRIIPGKFWSNTHGEIFVVENFYEKDYKQGEISVGLEGSMHILSEYLQSNALTELDDESIGFLDTETTGLIGGTGTLAFMIGVGKYENAQFHLAQFFLHDITEEPAMLIALEQFFTSTEILVTFNGKSFDLPLLRSRYVLQSWKDPLSDLIQVDLLHLSRRMWKDRLNSRTLINLEAQILKAYRMEEDVPGWMIPQMYFDYLQNGDLAPMKSVFYHNAMDVLSMAALLNYLCQVLSETQPTIEMPGLDLIAMAKFHEDFGDQRKAIDLYQQVLDHIDFKGGTELSEFYTGVILRLANIYKRQEQISPAIQLWEKAASQNSIQACIELAMVYEHREKNYRKAIHWTEIGVELAKIDVKDHGGEFWMEALDHRLTRLIRKLQSG